MATTTVTRKGRTDRMPFKDVEHGTCFTFSEDDHRIYMAVCDEGLAVGSSRLAICLNNGRLREVDDSLNVTPVDVVIREV